MSLGTEEKQKLINTHQVHPTDTGSAEVQVALITQRISDLTVHLKAHKHDYASRRGLKKLVGQRKRLLKYLNKTDVPRYLTLCKSLGIRP